MSFIPFISIKLIRNSLITGLFTFFFVSTGFGLEIDKFQVLAHKLELKAASMNRATQMQFAGNPYCAHFLKYVEEFAIGCMKLHQLSEKWYINGTGLSMRMDSLEYLAQQIQFAAVHTNENMTEFRNQWAEIKICYREVKSMFMGQYSQTPGSNNGAGGGLDPFPYQPGSGGQPGVVLPPQNGNLPGPVVLPPSNQTGNSGNSGNVGQSPSAPSY